MGKANYIILDITPELIVLEDIGPWDRYMTITNAAEAVIAELAQVIGNRKVFYYDSDNEFTEILVKEGQFAGFAPGGALEK